MSAQSVDDLLRDELLEIARLQTRGLSRYEALRRLGLEVDRDLGNHIPWDALRSAPGPDSVGRGARENRSRSLRQKQGKGADGEMLDPSWTPERGRSHVAALAGLAEGRRS